VGLVARLVNALDYMSNFLFGRFLGHVDDHRFSPKKGLSPRKGLSKKAKAAIFAVAAFG